MSDTNKTYEQKRRDMLHANYVRRVYAEEFGRLAGTYSATHPAYDRTPLCSDKDRRSNVTGEQNSNNKCSKDNLRGGR